MSDAHLPSNLEVSAYTAAEWMSVGLIDKLVPLADYERLRAAIETVLAEDPGIAHHEQAAHCEWARKHLSIALASAGMPMVEAKACEFSDNARHECKHCDAELAAVETAELPCCLEEHNGGFACTLPKGHVGRHEAWGSNPPRPRFLIVHWPAEQAGESK